MKLPDDEWGWEGEGCSPDTSITETELRRAVQEKKVKRLALIEVKTGFFLIAFVVRIGGVQGLYVTTRRERYEPRVWRNLERMNTWLKELAADLNVVIVRKQKLPPRG